jgi:hypothetical protein
MLKTFKAWLRKSQLDWIDEVPDVGDQIIQVHVTLLENEQGLDIKSRGRRMAEILENLAVSQTPIDVDPSVWQQCLIDSTRYG